MVASHRRASAYYHEIGAADTLSLMAQARLGAADSNDGLSARCLTPRLTGRERIANNHAKFAYRAPVQPYVMPA